MVLRFSLYIPVGFQWKYVAPFDKCGTLTRDPVSAVHECSPWFFCTIYPVKFSFKVLCLATRGNRLIIQPMLVFDSGTTTSCSNVRFVRVAMALQKRTSDIDNVGPNRYLLLVWHADCRAGAWRSQPACRVPGTESVEASTPLRQG